MHIEKQDSSEIIDKNISNKKVPISLLISEKLEKFVSEPKPIPKQTLNGWEDLGASLPPKESKIKGVLEKIDAMCMSPSKKEIAIFCAKNSSIYVFPSNLGNLKKLERLTYSIGKIDTDTEFDEDETNEIQALLSYNHKYQFLYCGNNSIALCGQRFILLVNKNDENISFKIFEESSLDLMASGTSYKCISEVDGLRYFSKDGVFLISEVSPELYNTCNPFGNNPGKKLIKAYGTFLSRNADCDQQIRKMHQDLPDAVKTLQMAAINIYFTNKNDECDLKEKQMLLLKASQYGKSFVQKNNFNFEKYVEKCRDLRIINSLRYS